MKPPAKFQPRSEAPLLKARSLFHEPNTALMALSSCSCGSCGNGLFTFFA